MTKYQFRVDGRAGSSPVRDTWAEAAQDAVSAGYGHWARNGTLKLDATAGGEVVRLAAKS